MRTICLIKKIILIIILLYIESKFAIGQHSPCIPTVNTAIGYCLPTQYGPDCSADYCNYIDPDFASDCPNCSVDLLGDVSPCYLKGVNDAGATGVGFNYVL